MSTTQDSIDEKKMSSGSHPVGDQELGTGDVMDPLNDDEFEVFKNVTDGVNFRTVGWPRASVIFLKSKPSHPRRFFDHT